MNRLIATLKDSASTADASSTPPASSAISGTPPGHGTAITGVPHANASTTTIGKRLAAGAQYKRIALREKGIGVLLEPDEAHPIRDAPLLRELFERRSQWSFAQQRQLRAPAITQRQGFDQQIEAFLVRQAPGGDQVRRGIGMRRRRLMVCRNDLGGEATDAFDIHGVVDNRGLTRRESRNG